MAQLKSTNITGNLSVTGEIVEQGEKIKSKYISGLSVSGKTVTYTKGDGTTGTITTQDTTYSSASSVSKGLAQVYNFYNSAATYSGTLPGSPITSTAPTVNAVTTTAGKYYGVEADKDGRLFVNVPWGSTTYSVATTSANGLMSADDKKNLTYYVKGTQTASTNAWTGTLSQVSALYEGLTIRYKLPYAGTSTGATLNLTLSGGTTTGAKKVYRYGTSTQITTHFSASSVITMTYDGTNWVVDAFYDSNNYAYVRQYTTTTDASYPILFAYETTLPDSYDTKYARKATGFTYNPSNKFLKVPTDGSTGGFKTESALFSQNDAGIPIICNGQGTREIAIGIDDTSTDSDYNTYEFPDKDGTVALISDMPNWWRAASNLRGTNNSNKTITYANTLYSFANGNVASSSNKPKAGDFIIDTYGSIYVVVSATTTNCTATQRWMSSAPWTCLEEGTLITLSDGTQKPIEEVKQGDLLLGYDFEKNKTTEAVALVCTATVEQDNTDYLIFSNGEYLSCTSEHEIYSATHKKYMFVKDLKEGDKSLNEKGEEIEIYSIHRWICSMGYKRFYQLVSSNNTYYANNVLNAMHPINKFNWLSYSSQQEIPEEIMSIFKADAEEFSCYEFLVKDKDFLKKSVNYQTNIKTRQNKIAMLKEKLLATDYIAIKKSEGLEVDENIINERQSARSEINKLEEEINTIYQPAYNNLLVSHSTIGEDILLSDEEKRIKYFRIACKRDNDNLEKFKRYYCNK